MAKLRWNLRLNPRVPRTELRIQRICGGSHSLDVVLVTGAERDLLGNHLSGWQRGAVRSPELRSERGRELQLQWTGFDLHLDDLVWLPGDVRLWGGSIPIEARVADHAVEFLVP